MLAGFLDRLTLSDDERRALASLAAKTPSILAHMIAARRDDFRRMIGDDARANAIEEQLVTLLSPAERETLGAETPRFALGARTKPGS